MDKVEEYWQAIVERDAKYDGSFYYGVTTTGVFCKPGCSSRLPLRNSVRFFGSLTEAERAGFRPCKKCKPTGSGDTPQPIEAVVHELCRYIGVHLDETITLAHIAARSGYSAAHIQKAFTASVGSSPKVYQAALRNKRFKQNLSSDAELSGVIYETGYSSPSRVYEKLAQNIGMTPRQYRDGGRAVVIHYATSHTSLGTVLIAATERGICFLHFGDSEQALLAALKSEFPKAQLNAMPTSGNEQFSVWIAALGDYLDHKKSLAALPLDIRGTAFQIAVWRFLQSIPEGEVRSYTDVAHAIGKPKAVRAVASACAHNGVALLIPCHRVLRGDGDLAGYRWGLERKRTLLDLEGFIDAARTRTLVSRSL